MTTDNNEKQPNSDSAAQRAADDRRGPSRRTASREERRNRAASRRARKRRFYMAGGLVIALALIAGLALPSFGIVNQTTDVPQAEPRAGTQLAVQDGGTLAPGETAQYDTDPPNLRPQLGGGRALGRQRGAAAQRGRRPQPPQRRNRFQLRPLRRGRRR